MRYGLVRRWRDLCLFLAARILGLSRIHRHGRSALGHLVPGYVFDRPWDGGSYKNSASAVVPIRCAAAMASWQRRPETRESVNRYRGLLLTHRSLREPQNRVQKVLQRVARSCLYKDLGRHPGLKFE